MSTEKSSENERILSRMRKVIEAERLNKTQVAERMGYSKGQVGWVLEGKAELSDKFFRAFCRTFAVSDHWLETGEGDMYDQALLPEKSQDEITPEDRALIRLWREAEQDAPDEVIKLYRKLISLTRP